MIRYLESKDRIARGVRLLGQLFWVLVNNVCSCTPSSQYDPALYLLHAFGVDVGGTQVVQNISNTYLEQIDSYLDMVFCLSILHGKHRKTNYCDYVSWSADKGTVGEANQLMTGVGFRDASGYR